MMFLGHCNLVDHCAPPPPPPTGRMEFSCSLSESSRIEEVITTIVYTGLGYLLLHLQHVLVFIQMCLFCIGVHSPVPSVYWCSFTGAFCVLLFVHKCLLCIGAYSPMPFCKLYFIVYWHLPASFKLL